MDEARRYLELHDEEIDDPKYRTLEYLYYSSIDENNEWIFTQEIIDWLKTIGIDLSEEQFRNDVIASLRDDGLIIVGSRKGIKIPTTALDFQEYVAFSVNLALPVLKRLKRAINFINLKTEYHDTMELISEEMKNILQIVEA